MSNKELDNLFKTKLKELEKQPSAGAWDKIQAQTENTKAIWPWMKIAASLLLLITVGALVWFTAYQLVDVNVLSDNKQHTPVETENNPSILADSIETKLESPDVKQTEKAAPKTTTEQKTPIEKQQKESQVIKQEPFLAKNNESVNNEEQLPKTEEVKSIDNLVEETKVASNELPDATIEKTNASTQQEAEVTGKTIEINLSDFSKTAIAQNTNKEMKPEQSEEKGLEKVLSLMKEIKSEAGLGDLREAKNEILAFNFKKQQNEDSK